MQRLASIRRECRDRSEKAMHGFFSMIDTKVSDLQPRRAETAAKHAIKTSWAMRGCMPRRWCQRGGGR